MCTPDWDLLPYNLLAWPAFVDFADDLGYEADLLLSKPDSSSTLKQYTHRYQATSGQFELVVNLRIQGGCTPQ